MDRWSQLAIEGTILSAIPCLTAFLFFDRPLLADTVVMVQDAYEILSTLPDFDFRSGVTHLGSPCHVYLRILCSRRGGW
ncbi:hypothetical protein LshimejAT787_2500410 [Lyophyllum shimeji]|uniref:Uncharacterized protein n=1 Tax=Lyophyllum shimeji TaxID=47721 RepID=A0A9P3Q205_LYOSH|nr:hypothetical protein LshimejAT787_2500400 [Lyophyllum shimeji]GLB45649.1 hypothetical protein LshimejAT787_2500410 [Lyophyllum shimeji]